jgi:threonine-phosphate decarboxylase
MTAHGGQFFSAAQQLGWSTEQALDQLLDFSASLNPLQPDFDLNINPALLMHYPPEQANPLQQLLAEKLQLHTEQIRLTNGISAAIFDFFNWLRPKQTLLYSPLYGEYARAAKLFSPHTQLIRRDLDTDSLLFPSQLNADSLVVLVNPATPDGRRYPRKQLIALLQHCQAHQAWLCIDESFLPFIGWQTEHSLRDQLAHYPKLIIFQSLTKYYGCAGIRIGAILAHPTQLENWPQATWPIATLDSLLMTQALQQANFDARTQAWLKQAKQDLITQLSDCRLIEKIYPSEANFILLKLHTPAQPLAEYLARQGLLIRACDNFGFNQPHIRLAVKTPAAHQRLATALDNYPC